MEPRRKQYGMQSQLVHVALPWYEIYTTQALYLVELDQFGVSEAKQRLRWLEHICRIPDNTKQYIRSFLLVKSGGFFWWLWL